MAGQVEVARGEVGETGVEVVLELEVEVARRGPEPTACAKAEAQLKSMVPMLP